MCLSYIPPRKGATPRFEAKRREAIPRPKPRRSTATAKKFKKGRQQASLLDWFGLGSDTITKCNEAIEASGDPLLPKAKGHIRYAFQNIHGISLKENLQVMPEIATIGSLQIDVAAFSETNLHWNQANRDKMSEQMNIHLGASRIVCASNVSTRQEDGYQPGGSMIAVTGPQVGRVQCSGGDPWGRFAWAEFNGSRDEGYLIISGYRVSQNKGTTAGPNTAYSQQINNMIIEGDLSLDPRTRILDDLRTLITSKRQEGFQPILMMDANDTWLDTGTKEFRSFVEEMQLIDPLYEKFSEDGLTSTTYSRGSRRIDFILVDASLRKVIKRIGTLGLHEGIISDHVMLYMDLDEREMFKGIVNRPTLNPCREFIIQHADKKKKFLDHFRKHAEKQNYKGRVKQIAQDFSKYGDTQTNTDHYQKLDTEIKNGLLGAAKKVARSDFGYQRSEDLGEDGHRLHLWKAIQSAKHLRMQLPEKVKVKAREHSINVDEAMLLSRKEIRKQVRQARAALWDVQKQAAEKRIEWLEKNAQDIAKAAGELDWKKKMDDMAKLTRQRTSNRRMTTAIKGAHKSLQEIEVPKYEWFYSRKTSEIYRYHMGVFEAYAPYTPQAALKPTHPTVFYTHHHLKVLPPDAVRAEVELKDDNYHLTLVYMPCELWRQVTNQKELERTVLARNKRHLQQAVIEDSRVHDPIMQRIIEQYGTGDLVDDIIEGKITLDEGTDEAIQAWISAVRQTASKLTLPRTTGAFSVADYQGAYKAVNEQTTSSPTGLHYSIWKTVAAEDDLAEWLSIMMSLPFMYGFVNERWVNMVDVMLEKKKGVRKIHLLRIIGILEADFNTALKILFARKLMRSAEQQDMLHTEQWGSRPNRTAHDAAMLKMLTFEYGRYMKATIALFANDQTACFDRMWPELSNTVAYACGMDKKVLKCRAKTIEAMNRKIKTGLGVSSQSYGNTPDEPKITGEIQGKGDVASLWAIMSSMLLLAHSFVWTGLDLPSPSGRKGIKRNNAGYVDDVDTLKGTMKYGPIATLHTMKALEIGAQKWANIQDVVSQSTAFHKCMTSVLGWKEVNSSLQIDYEYQYDMVLSDLQGATSKITLMAPDEPNKGLGFHQALDGNMKSEFENRRAKINEMCQAVSSLQPNQLDANTMLTCRLTPQTVYGMRLTSFSSKQCHQLDKLIMGSFLGPLKVNRSSPRAMVFGPIQLGGMGIAKQESLQDQWGLYHLVQTLRWDEETAHELITVLDAFQMASGFVTPVLKRPEIVIDYVGIGWIPHIRNRLAALNGSLEVEKAWRPRIQRINDDSLMEVIDSTPAIKPKMRRLFNECRIWLNITVVSELANEEGTAIPMDRLRGEWKAEAMDELTFPNQPDPSKEHWANFRKCLRLTFCRTASPWQRTGVYKLDTKLEEWFVRKRQIHYQCNISSEGVFWRAEEKYYKCIRSSTTNFYTIQKDTPTQLPDKSHPIAFRRTSETGLWAWRRYRPKMLPTITENIQVNEDSFVEKEDANMYLVSDAAVHVKKGLVAGAWHLYSDRNEKRRVALPLQHQLHSHSFRHEMETFYHGLKDADERLKHPHQITQAMDCEGGLTKLNANIYTPRQTMATDMDIVLAYKELEKRSKHTIRRKWVMGHADEKKKAKPETITPLEHDNIACDDEANQCVFQGMSAQSFQPLPGYKAMLKLDDDWVTTHFRASVNFAHVAPAMKVYILRRLDIDDRIFEEVDWRAIGKVRSSHRINRIVRTSKMMYRWLPVGHNWQKCNLPSDKCPCCGADDETFHHLLRCENEQITSVRQDILPNFRIFCAGQKIPANFTDFFVKVIFEAMGTPNATVTKNEFLRAAYKSQQAIGLGNFMVGFLSTGWEAALDSLGVENSSTKMEAILTFIWDAICEPIWFVRNDIHHSKQSHVSTDDMVTLDDRLQWYIRHQHKVLDYRHRFLVDYDVDVIARWSRSIRKQKITMLDNARHWYTTQCNTRAKNQSTIHDWMDKYIRLRNGKLIGKGIVNAISTLPPSDGYSSDESEEYEFDWDFDPS